ncbi:hypothetical protein CTAYLR_000308 [Chrysophaeum taylorii]|uniref:GPI inositol-deacylase PGAP1-like alpha/beta domain-containing protein n=1 Tax=Chrysophaeum taylorii TaxID=2483200 RepID=A0AAD7XM46_9STRA|nr:hypothetical protein CTAYLR_000308 [Chrysophaeum taylorii]
MRPVFEEADVDVTFQAAKYSVARSLGSELARIEADIDLFAVDLLEELAAFDGRVLERQAAFVAKCVRVLRSTYPLVLVVGHSIGGFLAAAASGDAAIALAAPLAAHPMAADPRLDGLARRRRRLENVAVSVSGGPRDWQVADWLASVEAAHVTAEDIVGVSTDHQCVLWFDAASAVDGDEARVVLRRRLVPRSQIAVWALPRAISLIAACLVQDRAAKVALPLVVFGSEMLTGSSIAAALAAAVILTRIVVIICALTLHFYCKRHPLPCLVAAAVFASDTGAAALYGCCAASLAPSFVAVSTATGQLASPSIEEMLLAFVPLCLQVPLVQRRWRLGGIFAETTLPHVTATYCVVVATTARPRLLLDAAVAYDVALFLTALQRARHSHTFFMINGNAD